MSLIEVSLFLCAIILAVSGPRKIKKKGNKTDPDAHTHSAYRVTPNGRLEYVETDN
ncbi:hypothetical protein ACFFGT_30870 [Mucilaginibacter angelicae]|uniref:Uncharacterized protein n=1 Tax=Mucilaginibacter angelicae TaxID=869718 RepID=A0ABV6LGU0_9SPHI